MEQLDLSAAYKLEQLVQIPRIPQFAVTESRKDDGLLQKPFGLLAIEELVANHVESNRLQFLWRVIGSFRSV